jgi:DNA polymerase
MQDIFYRQATETRLFPQFCAAFESGCSRCTLSNLRSKPIIYRGNPESDILLIGESPGQEEEKQKVPFCGPAGILLNKIMKAIGLNTETDMCITNSTFCRPANTRHYPKQNYTPKKEQLVQCWPFVERIVDILEPPVIIACGRTALSQLTEDVNIRMGPWEGRWLSHKSGAEIFVMRHPAAILHQAPWPEEQRETKMKVWKYMQYFSETWKEKAG